MWLHQIGRAPSLFEDLVVSQHLAGIGYEKSQQVIFRKGKRYFLSPQQHQTSMKINLQIINSVNWLRQLLQGTPEHRKN